MKASLLLPSRLCFSKAPPTSSMHYLCPQSEDLLTFFLLSKAGWLQFLIQIWPHERKNYLKNSICKCYSDLLLPLCSDIGGNYFRASSTVYDELMLSDKPSVLKYDNRLCSSDYGFQIRNDTIIVGWKAIHHHRADQNPHQRWSCPERESALHHPSYRGRDPLFSRASGASSLDAICTHSADIWFWLGFERGLTRVCQFL